MAILPDKQVKKEFKKVASVNPEKFYPVEVLKELGFMRKQCSCGTFFWTTNMHQEKCGDPSCSGGFSFIGASPVKEAIGYTDVWKKVSEMFKKQGYASLKRYPVVSRWNPTSDFTLASISAFQPYVISGEAKAPAEKLVIPQFCLRFNDVDNVGITGSHHTGFVMIGQHAFMEPQKWNQAQLFRDIHSWLAHGLKLPDNEITFHEDAWAGGGNFGPCMEFFSRGCELGNQVYMMYEQTASGNRDLKLKVLDMGMGQERNAWFSQGTPTIYQAVFPSVCAHLFDKTGVDPSDDLMKRFTPYASYLNVDEVEDIDAEWKKVAKILKMDVAGLKETILPLTGIYSIAEHSRSLLFALTDGALPSNVGGGYNLRVITRRALAFMDKYDWQIDMGELCEMHASYLKTQYPELKENLPQVLEILEVEKQKFKENRVKSHRLIQQLIEKESKKQEGAQLRIPTDELIKLYDSQGISPESIQIDARALGKKIDVPDNFYTLVASLHEQKEQETATKREFELDISDLSPSQALYFGDWSIVDFNAQVVKISGAYVVLDKTHFYPTSGGQIHDTGKIGGRDVLEVFKQGSVIIHKLDHAPEFAVGSTVECSIDLERRKQLTQHHTATHIVNGAARLVLGNHIWQAGAAKTLRHARLDITHYAQLSAEQVSQIESEANLVIRKDLPVNKMLLPRDEAERRFGFRLYQGGAVPGSKIRVVEIADFDVEACGGTHLNRTSEAEVIKIIKTSKIQDGIVRIEFSAGNAAKFSESEDAEILSEIAKLLSCEQKQIPGRAQELFNLWKTVVKKKKAAESLVLKSTQTYDGDVLKKTSEILRTQPAHLAKTIERFWKEIKEQ